MSRFWKLLVSVLLMSIAAIVIPIAPVQALTRTALNYCLTTIA